MNAQLPPSPSRALSWSLGLISALYCLSPHTPAQQGPFTPWVGKRGITETVDQIMTRERAHPFVYDGIPREGPEAEGPDRSHLPQNPSSPLESQWPAPRVGEAAPPGVAPAPPITGAGGAATGSAGSPHNPQTPGTSFNGTLLSQSGFIPPDSCGAIGPTQVLFCSNGRIRVYDRTGTLGPLDASSDVFFASVVTPGQGTSDPQVKYDALTGRWIVTMIDVTPASNSVLIAMSSGPTITGSGSFTFFSFQHDVVLPPGDAGQFADYPKVGVDANAIYIGVNIFGPGGVLFIGSTGFVVKKSSVLSGGSIEVTAFRGLGMNGGSDGPFAPTGVDNPDPSATEGYFIGSSIFNLGLLVMRRVTDPGGTPSISSNLNITVPATATPNAQPAQGSANALDALDDRLFAAQVHKNRLTGATSLWTAHNILVNSSGVASGGDRNGSRWYEIGTLTGSPGLIQSGTLFDNASSNPKGYWIPSCSMTGQGHMALGSSYAGNADHAGVAASGRLSGDALGTLRSPSLVAVSAGNYNVQSGGTQRWGDYSATFVDPLDDQTVWTFQEWCNTGNSWAVRVVQLLAPLPATPTNAAPPSVSIGSSSVNVVITGTSVSGTEFYDTEPGLNRIQATTSNPGITVNSVTFDNPTQVTLNIDVDMSAALGPVSVTITNPDGQSSTSSLGILDVESDAMTGFCYPDVGGIRSCPCGNPQVPALSAKGCNNFGPNPTGGTGGATLTAQGVPHASISSTLQFDVGSMIAPASGTITVLWKGNLGVSPGFQSGAGVRCITTSLSRIYKGQAFGGAISFPNVNQTTNSWTASLMPGAGTTLRYYAAYRNAQAGGPCGDANLGFNLTNAGAVTWLP